MRGGWQAGRCGRRLREHDMGHVPEWWHTLHAKALLHRERARDSRVHRAGEQRADRFDRAYLELAPLGLADADHRMLAHIESRGGYGVTLVLAAAAALVPLSAAQRSLDALAGRGLLLRVERPDDVWFVLPRHLDAFSTAPARRARDRQATPRRAGRPAS
jgi:hypothetical protein